MRSKTVQVTIMEEGNNTAIPVPFDPKAAFGKVRAPVEVTINGYSYRSTIARMQGQTFVPLRKSHREAAGVSGGQRVRVTFRADTEPRVVEVPGDLAVALSARAGVEEAFRKLSYTNQREAVESVMTAKRSDTRARRIARIVEKLGGQQGD